MAVVYSLVKVVSVYECNVLLLCMWLCVCLCVCVWCSRCSVSPLVSACRHYPRRPVFLSHVLPPFPLLSPPLCLSFLPILTHTHSLTVFNTITPSLSPHSLPHYQCCFCYTCQLKYTLSFERQECFHPNKKYVRLYTILNEKQLTICCIKKYSTYIQL